jgi:hypothetical protein
VASRTIIIESAGWDGGKALDDGRKILARIGSGEPGLGLENGPALENSGRGREPRPREIVGRGNP